MDRSPNLGASTTFPYAIRMNGNKEMEWHVEQSVSFGVRFGLCVTESTGRSTPNAEDFFRLVSGVVSRQVSSIKFRLFLVCDENDGSRSVTAAHTSIAKPLFKRERELINDGEACGRFFANSEGLKIVRRRDGGMGAEFFETPLVRGAVVFNDIKFAHGCLSTRLKRTNDKKFRFMTTPADEDLRHLACLTAWSPAFYITSNPRSINNFGDRDFTTAKAI
jgi:hypothetical protein